MTYAAMAAALMRLPQRASVTTTPRAMTCGGKLACRAAPRSALIAYKRGWDDMWLRMILLRRRRRSSPGHRGRAERLKE